MTAPSSSNLPAKDRPIRVLYFEDDPADAFLMQRALEKAFLMRFETTTVRGLAEGLQRLGSKSYDVAFLDLNLSDSEGLETFERLRTAAPDLPVIVLTGNQDDRLAVQILRQGAQDYLLKHEAAGPLLAKSVRYAIERHRVRVELNLRAARLAENEATLRRALREKVVLLKEIHHRVKNNLQIISSLLNLQSRRIKQPETLDIFRESCDRIQVMALIHEKLYSARDLGELDFKDYLHSLAAMLLRSYASASRQVKFHFRLAQGLHLNLDLAIPVGLVACELISNSLKHAFLRGAKGTITLELAPDGPSTCVLRISDDGRGLPENFSMEQPTSLGLRLVKMLAQQLQGQLSWSRTPATAFTLVFPYRTKSRRLKYEPGRIEST